MGLVGAALELLHSHPHLENELKVYLSTGVDETLQTMAHVSSIFEKSIEDENWKSPCELSVYLEIQTPPVKGQIRFHFSQTVLENIYKNMMNEEATPDYGQVVDILGELSNVSYGLCKGKMNREGYSLGMALPHPGKTKDLPEVIATRSRTVIPFKVFNETCYIEILIL